MTRPQGCLPAADLSKAGPFDDAQRAVAVPYTADYRHPRAHRELRLGEHLVGYELRRARRRSIGFVVRAEGLSVAAPRWVGVADIEDALRGKSAWILRKLAEQRERARRHEAAKVEWRDGASLPFLGEPMTLVLDAHAQGAALEAQASLLPGASQRTAARRLRVGMPAAAEPARIRAAVEDWLQRQAIRLFEERCALYAPRLGVRVKRLALSNAQMRWGSASADGSVRFSWRLVHFGLPTIDYVVAHELAHLRHMDHSPQFWALVRSVIPDVDAARGTLRDDVLPVF